MMYLVFEAAGGAAFDRQEAEMACIDATSAESAAIEFAKQSTRWDFGRESVMVVDRAMMRVEQFTVEARRVTMFRADRWRREARAETADSHITKCQCAGCSAERCDECGQVMP
jgi:hypothetical protein